MSNLLQFSAVFVKKHLLESLVNKIKVLKLLTYKHKVRADTILKTVERLCPNEVTPAFKDYLGIKSEPKKAKSESPPKIGKNLVMTPRVKLIEETVKHEVIGKLYTLGQDDQNCPDIHNVQNSNFLVNSHSLVISHF